MPPATVMMTPTWWKRNVYLSIWVRCLLNLLGTVGLMAVILGFGG